MKVLLLGTSFSAVPVAEILLSLGYEVSICGSLTADPLVTWGLKHYIIDYKDYAAIEKIISAEKYDYVIPSCNDASYRTLAEISKRYFIPGIDNNENSQIFLDKLKFKQVIKELGIPTPKSYNYQDAIDMFSINNTTKSLIVKPSDSFAGRGCQVVRNKDDLINAIEEATRHSKKGQVIIEDFITGTLHSYSAFISSQEIVADFFVDEFCTVYPYQVNNSNHPSKLASHIRLQMKHAITKLTNHINLSDGLIHTQFILHNETPYLIESMRRCPGDLFGLLVQHSTGYQYYLNYVLPFLGKKPSQYQKGDELPYIRHTISKSESARVSSYSVEIPDVISVKHFPTYCSGQKVEHSPYGKVGIILALMKNFHKMWEIAPKVEKYVQIETL